MNKKNIYLEIKLIAILCIMVSYMASGQKILFKSETPVGDANVILIETPLDDAEAFKVAGRILVKTGYTVEKAAEDFQYISTKPENRENYSFPTNITVSILDQKLIIRGFYYQKDRRHSGFFKRNGVKSLVTFRFMDEYAQELKQAVHAESFEYGVEKVL